MVDLTKIFEGAFAKFDVVKSQGSTSVLEGNNTSTKIMPENYDAINTRNAALYPEKIGERRREEKLKSQNEYEDFIKSISEDEYNNLVVLARDRVIFNKEQLIAMGESGESLNTERLEKAQCIKRELIDDMIEMRITGAGRRLLTELNKRIGK